MAESATKKRKLEGEEDDTPVASLDDVMQLIILWGMNPADFDDVCFLFSSTQLKHALRRDFGVSANLPTMYPFISVLLTKVLCSPTLPRQQKAYQAHHSSQPS
jgi:hypothetical protein